MSNNWKAILDLIMFGLLLYATGCLVWAVWFSNRIFRALVRATTLEDFARIDRMLKDFEFTLAHCSPIHWSRTVAKDYE